MSQTESADGTAADEQNGDPEIRVMRYAGHEYAHTTTVYTKSSSSEVFHADKECPHLVNTAEYSPYHGEDLVHLNAHPLPKVLSSYTNPVKPCDHCTLPMEETAKVGVQLDGMDSIQLCIFETGETRVTTQVSRNEDGTTSVSHSTEVIGE